MNIIINNYKVFKNWNRMRIIKWLQEYHSYLSYEEIENKADIILTLNS